jgi:hypothetical protein
MGPPATEVMKIQLEPLQKPSSMIVGYQDEPDRKGAG